MHGILGSRFYDICHHYFQVPHKSTTRVIHGEKKGFQNLQMNAPNKKLIMYVLFGKKSMIEGEVSSIIDA